MPTDPQIISELPIGQTAEDLRRLSQNLIDDLLQAASTHPATASEGVDCLPQGSVIVAIIMDHPDHEPGAAFIPLAVGAMGSMPVPRRPWTMLCLSSIDARRELADDLEEQTAYVIELLNVLQEACDEWFGLTVGLVDPDELRAMIAARPRTHRHRARRTERPSGRGGTSRKQKRKR